MGVIRSTPSPAGITRCTSCHYGASCYLGCHIIYRYLVVVILFNNVYTIIVDNILCFKFQETKEHGQRVAEIF